MLLSICSSLAGLQLVPMIAAHSTGVNFGTTRFGQFMLKADTNYFFADICYIAYILCTLILFVKTLKSNFNVPAKIAISIIVLYSNYVLVFPMIAVTNMMLRPFCENGPMNLNKEKYFPYSKVLEANFSSVYDEIVNFMDTRKVPCLNELRSDILLPVTKRCHPLK